MALSLAAVVDTEVTARRPRRPAASPRRDEDSEFAAALLGVLRDGRWDEAEAISRRLKARGVDPTVVGFVEDDLREATEALADIEVFFQESIEALLRPFSPVLEERAADASVLERVDHLHLVLSGLRRRLVQVAAGVRR